MQKDANLVELEKCCRTHIFLQNFVLIQPRTSPPKICKIFEKCIFENAVSKNTFFENAFFENAPGYRAQKADQRSSSSGCSDGHGAEGLEAEDGLGMLVLEERVPLEDG